MGQLNSIWTFFQENVGLLKPHVQARMTELFDKGDGPLLNINYVYCPNRMDHSRHVRWAFPSHRREEAKEVPSGSNDRDIRYKLVKEEGMILPDLFIQASLRAATSRVMGVYTAIADKAKELGLNVMWNGHLDFLPSVITQENFLPTDSDEHAFYYNGGGNGHLALSGQPREKANLKRTLHRER